MNKLFLLGYLLFCSLMAHANLLIVDSNQDVIQVDGNCTLREAITAANFDISVDQCGKGLGDDLIWVLFGTSGDSIQLNNQLGIIDGVDIQGPGADKLVLIPSNNHDGHIFQINTTDDVTIQDMRIGGARSSAIDVVNVGELIIEDMQLLNNTADTNNDFGGAIHADTEFGSTATIDALTIRRSELNNNHAYRGGAVAASGEFPLVIEDSVFVNNSSSSHGGAILRHNSGTANIQEASVWITGSTFGSNQTTFGAAAIDLYVQSLSLSHSLFYDNEGSSVIKATHVLAIIENNLFVENLTDETFLHTTLGPAIPSEITLKFNTFLNNQTVDIEVAGSQSETIIRANVFDSLNTSSCNKLNGGVITSAGENVERSGASCYGHQNDLSNTDPELMPLGFYGGNVLIAPPSPISPLVDAGAACNTIDLSGEGRPRDGDGSGSAQCDIGAVERPDANLLSVVFSGNGSGQVNLSDFDLSCYSNQGCTWPLPQNETYSLQPVADSGSTFIQWGSACSGDTSCDVTMDTAKQVTAEFAQVAAPVTLTVVKNLADPQLGLSVTSSPAGIDCGNTCSAGFIEGDVVNLTADVEPGTLVDSWQNCDLVLQNGRLCKTGLSGDTTITVNVIADPDVIFANGFE